MLKDKIDFLKGPGGMRAASYFGLKLLTRIDVFRVAWILTQPNSFLTIPSGWRYVSFYTCEELSRFSSVIIKQAAQQCGSDPIQLIERGGSLHLLLVSNQLAAQLSIERGPFCQIDSPPLRLNMAETDAFLSYLYTWPAYRRQKAAQCLISATVSDLSRHNISRMIAHIRATNVPSLAAFEHSGWQFGAMILCTLGGRLLLTFGTAKIGLTFRPAVDGT